MFRGLAHSVGRQPLHLGTVSDAPHCPCGSGSAQFSLFQKRGGRWGRDLTPCLFLCFNVLLYVILTNEIDCRFYAA